MELYIDKFEYFINLENYTLECVYVQDGRIVYVQVLSPKYVHQIFVEIPRSFNFMIGKSDTKVIKIQPTEIRQDSDEHVEHYDNIRTAGVHINLPIVKHKTNTNVHLNDMYKNKVNVKTNRKYVYNAAKQLSRLEHCIEGTPYSIAILDNNQYLYTHQHVCKIIDQKNSKNVSLIFVVDIKRFYDKIQDIEKEIDDLYIGVYTVLNTNHKTHANNIDNLFKTQKNLVSDAKESLSIKHSIMTDIQSHTNILHDMLKEYTIVTSKLDIINSTEKTNFYQELKNKTEKTILNTSRERLDKNKTSVVKKLKELWTHNSTIMLKIDDILYENLIMLDKILINFNQVCKLNMELRNVI
jgi:hypothetical protein